MNPKLIRISDSSLNYRRKINDTKRVLTFCLLPGALQIILKFPKICRLQFYQKRMNNQIKSNRTQNLTHYE